MASERQEHNEATPWWGEHIHRYNVALTFLQPDSLVLDLACGNGFGSNMLSHKTRGLVIGGDISAETITLCSEKFSIQPNLKFRVIDGTQMPFENQYFDNIVSFETIEHTTQYYEMLGEFYRTLKTNGTCIISTPNIKINSPTGKVLNPYHTQEFTLEELSTILNKIFDQVDIYGQKYIRYKYRSLKNTVAKTVETILYMRGIRKIPLKMQDKIMNLFIGKNMYPHPEDFVLVSNKEEIIQCKTFFAVCRKK